MSLEELKEIAARVIKALTDGGLKAELHEDDIIPGKALPLTVIVDDEYYTLDLLPA